MTIPSLVKNFANLTYKLAKEPGKMLLIVGSMGWVFSSIAQVTAIVINNKIPEEQKKFLIPQEISDAAVNITSFIIFTRSFTKFGEKFVKSGKIATSELREIYKQKIIDGKSVNSLISKDFNISELHQITDKSHKDYNEKFSETYFKFADGVSFVSSVIGSIISCNIVTPILRNKIAAYFQKQAIAQENMKSNNMVQPASPTTFLTQPAVPAQNRTSIEDYKSKIMNTNSSSMKI